MPEELKPESTLYGCWHNAPGAAAKLICWGYAQQHSEVIKAFAEGYPTKSTLNLVLTTDRSLEEYVQIAADQLGVDEVELRDV